MRALMTADAVGGVWTYALDLAAGLAASGVRTTLVVLGPQPTPDQVRAAHAVRGLELVETGLPLDWTAAEPAEILETAAAVRGLARGLRADVIHLNSPALAAIGGFSAPVLGAVHSCLATWWAAVKDGPLPPDFRWRTQALWQGLHACDALVAPTRAFAEATARAYELPVPNVVWNGRAPPKPGGGARAPIVVTTGRFWDEGKNVGVLDAAAARIRAPVFAAGPLQGPNGACASLHHARPLGRLSATEVEAWLARAQVFASSALYEPFGLGALEAAQAGCALVLSDIDTFRELWDGAALFVDPDDPRGFADACNRLLADEDLRAELAAKALRTAGRHSVEAMSAGVLGLYRMLRPQPAALAREAAA